jgi:hypothetical protein
MAIDLTNMRVDISKLGATDLRLIQNEVLSAIAGRLIGGDAAAGHDSHSSSHGKNSVVAFDKIESNPAVVRLGG